MRVSFYNLGCKVNFADIVQLGKMFENQGHTIVEFEQESDLVLINTCTVTQKADADCRKIIRRSQKFSPNAFVGVLGCYAQLQPGEIAAIDGVDAVFGTKEKFDIPRLLSNFDKRDKTEIFVSDLEDVPFHTSASNDTGSRTRGFLKLQDGCDYKCSFCTIPMARGKSRSSDFAEIPSQINSLLDQGFSEIVLSGINLGDFRAPTGETFTDVVRLLDKFERPFRARISSIEPNLLTEEIIDVVADSAVFCPHFHIPLQSGSVEILQRMRRRYKVSHYHDLVYKIKDKIPHASIGVDVIIGFPGETEDHFYETYEFIRNLPVTYLHVFTYSERENTAAAEFGNVVPKDVRKGRTNRMRMLSLEKTDKFYRGEIGRTRTVIPEVYNPVSKMWKGWTENYVRVIFNGPETLENKPYPVLLKEVKGDKVLAELID